MKKQNDWTEIDERFDEEFVERHIWEEIPLLYDTDFKEIKRLKDFLHSELEKVRQETIDEMIKEGWTMPTYGQQRPPTKHELRDKVNKK